MLSVEKIVAEQLPQLPPNTLKTRAITWMLQRVMHEGAFIQFEQDHPSVFGYEFVEEVLRYFNFSYTVKHHQKENIPATGRVVIVCNHPIGSLDALALCHCISDVRKDVKMVANDVLMELAPIRELLLPVNAFHGGTKEDNLQAIESHLENEGALIIFPAGTVSRMSAKGVVDDKWRTGFLRYATATRSPILPVFAKTRNSMLFYGVSMMNRPLSSVLLIDEMFKHRNKELDLVIGDLVPYSAYKKVNLPLKHKATLFKKHVYHLGKGKKGVFKTERGIALPESRRELSNELKRCELLGETQDGKHIYLFSCKDKSSSPVMRELGRLREVAFRAVGEGSGKRRDIDKFDYKYQHIVMWDAQELEIVGAYRLALTKPMIKKRGIDGLYSSTLFNFDEKMQPYLDQGMELGRSFVQPRYWGRRSLDYLWFGVGAYIAANPDCRYLFGPVSISNTLPSTAKALLVHFYSLYFGSEDELVTHKQPYDVPRDIIESLASQFSGNDYEDDFIKLKSILADMGTSVPTLYKQYSELCEPGGVRFLDFGVDPDFADCIDGMVMVDVTKMHPKKYHRYVGSHLIAQSNDAA